MADASLRSDPGPVADVQVADYADLSRQGDAVAERRATGDPDLGDDDAALSDVTLWAMCTRLSIFVPAPTRVSPTEPRSMQTLAPTSTSSSSTHRPTCGTFLCWFS